MDCMDVDAMFDMPGGDDFRNVTRVFIDAAKGKSRNIINLYISSHILLTKDMEPGSIIFTEGFSLQDSMSVLEVCRLCHHYGLSLICPHSPRSENRD